MLLASFTLLYDANNVVNLAMAVWPAASRCPAADIGSGHGFICPEADTRTVPVSVFIFNFILLED
jgi:hypothetical protein